MASRNMDQQLIVQAQHDRRVDRGTPGAHRDGPHLEQLRRSALDERVAPVAPARCRLGGGRVAARHLN